MTDSLLGQGRSKSQEQPWLQSSAWDLLYIAAPAFITSIVALLCKDQLENMKSLPLWAWISFVLLVDVAHVYATLFRTYFDNQAVKKNCALLAVVPFGCWAVGSLLYSIDGLLFWRVLAYFAVFHFVRQQYGFVSLYSRKDAPVAQKFRRLDAACIYLATLYPLMFWHTNLPRNFNWFIEGDFIKSVPMLAANICLGAYIIVACLYILKELMLLKTSRFLNIPRNLIVFGTALSWWVAIVAINSDMSFTMINVISHGVPYMALIWLYHRSKRTADFMQTAQAARSGSVQAGDTQPFQAGDTQPVHPGSASILPASATCIRSAELQKCNAGGNFQPAIRMIMSFAPAFLLFLFLLAYLEEGLWAGLVWREHMAVFRPFASLPAITNGSILAILVPLLSLPQSTHYVLDGFIWKAKDRSRIWFA